MKKTIISLTLAAVAMPFTGNCAIDPVLTAGVEFHTVQIRDTYKERKSLQEKIIEMDAAITFELDRVHKVENDILDYMSNASAAIDNMYQLKQITDLVPEIYQEYQRVQDAIKRNPKGVVFAGLASKQWTKIYQELMQSTALITELVQTGKTNADNKKKVNLLSAAERYEITNTIYSNLRNIKYSLWILAYQIRYWTWMDVWMNLDYRSWAGIIGMKANADYAIRMWNKTFNSPY
ncbi:MAG: hypothetical protein NC187_00545 [Candidatus Amulumruptor caecigallinarius]|nr:hypothetical protein [Candidatus Amulumruptor caecigallinarius]MCM1395965.1 hypothetical protein [Candidatus Amulumruptor caecigallinarius]MCM1453000.1 hypothetical protein [bacterium]